MDDELEYTLLEGQSKEIVIKPTFEAQPVADKTIVDQDLTPAQFYELLSPLVPSEDKVTGSIKLTAKGVVTVGGQLVFKYTGNESTAENIGISTKDFTLAVNPAILTVDGTATPTKFKWIPGEVIKVGVKYKNGTEPLANDDVNLFLSLGGTDLELESVDETGVELKIKDSVDPATLPTEVQSLIATYYSGTTATDLSFALKPALTITSEPTTVGLNDAGPFPLLVKDGDTDVTDSLTNIVASDTDGYLEFEPDGTFTVMKADPDEVVKSVTLTFDYTEDGLVWSYTGTADITIRGTTVVEPTLENVSTPLTMDLWGTQPLTFQVMKDGSNIAPSITSVTVDPASIADKFEFSEAEGVYSFKSIQSSTTEVVTATAKLTVAGTDGGVAYSLEADVVLNTNINDGTIPTNRFNVEVEQ